MTWQSKFERAGVYLLPLGNFAHAEAPYLMPGDTVKLVFALNEPISPHARGERMWVQVTHRGQDGHYAGLLTNEPNLVELEVGDEIFFGPHHVLEVWAEPLPAGVSA